MRPGRQLVAGVALLAAVVAGLVSAATTVLLQSRQPPTAAGSPSGSSGASDQGSGSGFARLYREVASGVVQVQTTACGQGSSGSGFLIAPDLVVTVAHVVAGAHSILLQAGATSVPGTVVGVDPVRELALVRAARPFDAGAHLFGFDPAPPPIGSDVVALGYPLGGALSLVPGTVAGLDRSLDLAASSGPALSGPSLSGPSLSGSSSGPPSGPAEPTRLTGLIQVSVPVNPGNSGGPLLSPDGRVVGVVDARAVGAEGIGYAVPSGAAAPVIAGWQRAPKPVDVAGDCSDPVGPATGDVRVKDLTGSAQGATVADLLARHAAAINSGDYRQAWSLHSARVRVGDYQSFALAERSSLIFDLVLRKVTAGPSGVLLAEATFTTAQDAALGRNGQTCSLWHLTYQLVDEAGQLRIDRAGQQGAGPTAC